jgi:Rv0078B-related antitoxin
MPMPTDPAKWEMVDDTMAAVLRQKTEVQRLAIADGLWRMARQIVTAQLRTDHPEWTPEQIRHETARRMSHGAV